MLSVKFLSIDCQIKCWVNIREVIEDIHVFLLAWEFLIWLSGALEHMYSLQYYMSKEYITYPFTFSRSQIIMSKW